MKKKILITVHSLEIGGIERSLIGLLDVIDYERFDVDVLLYARKGELLELVSPKCTVLPQDKKLATFLQPIKQVLFEGHPCLAAARLYSKWIVPRKFPTQGDPKRQDGMSFAHLQAFWDNSIRFLSPLPQEYDAAISFMWPHHFVAQKVRAKKKIAWVHTDFTIPVVDARRDAAMWDQFDRICAVSDACGQAFLQTYPQFRDKLTVIENILPKSFVEKSAQAFDPQDMPAEDGVFRLLSVGRACYAKAFDRVVRVCRILKDRGVPFRWYIIGYGTGEQTLRDDIRTQDVEDCCIFLGKKTNPYPYMRRCDLYVQPSRYEGKAVTIREAQMLERPVMITDFQTARSQVHEDVDALIVPQDEQAIADAVERLIADADRRDTLSQNTKRFDYSNAEEVDKLYRLIG